VIARRQLRNNATVLRMQVNLTVQRVAQQPGFGIEQGDTGFIT